MARSRNIKPGFFLNEELAEIEPLGRLLFAGLWTIADREGRLEDRPRRIKAAVLPYDDCDVDHLLNELYKQKFIIRYEVDGARYIQITNWHKHQNPHCKEKPSTIPAQDTPGARMVQVSNREQADDLKKDEPKNELEPEPFENQEVHGAQNLHHTCTVQAPEKNETSPADSFNLIPDSFNPNTAASKITQYTIEDPATDDNGPVIDAAADELKSAESDDWLSDDLTEEQQAEMKKVTDHWRRKRAILVIPPADLDAMEELVKKGIPAADIIKGIDKAFSDFAERNRSQPWKKINSFRYCLQTIHEIHQARTTGGNVRPFPGRSPEPARPNVIDEGALEKYRAMMERAKRKTQTGG